MIADIDPDSAEDAKRILNWLCFAKRPMLVEEMVDGLAVELGDDPRFDPNRRLVDVIDILDICPGLVSIDMVAEDDRTGSASSGTLRIAHFSVQEYLLSVRTADQSAAGYHLEAPIANAELARSCLLYLLQFDTEEVMFEYEFANYPLADYAARFWADHMRESGENEDLCILARTLFSSKFAFLAWARLFDLHGSARRRGITSNLESEDLATPLFYVSAMGLDSMVEAFLMETGTDVNARRKIGGWNDETIQTPLQFASARGHVEVMNLLLAAGADPSLAPPGSYPALYHACGRGSLEAVDLLLKYGSDVNARPSRRGGWKSSPLHRACFSGHNDITQLLIENGAEVNNRGLKGQTPLHPAGRRGHIRTIQLLLRKGCDRTARDEDGRTPFLAAADSSTLSLELLQELAYPGVYREHDNVGLTSLMIILKNPAFNDFKHAEIIKWLLQNGADCHALDDSGRTALHHTLGTSARLNCADLLVSHGCQVDVTCKLGRLPLHIWADLRVQGAESGTQSKSNARMMRLLSQDGATINAVDNQKRTAAHLAASHGHRAFLEQLMSAGCSVFVLDEDEISPLHRLENSLGPTALEALLTQAADGQSEPPSGNSTDVNKAISGVETSELPVSPAILSGQLLGLLAMRRAAQTLRWKLLDSFIARRSEFGLSMETVISCMIQVASRQEFDLHYLPLAMAADFGLDARWPALDLLLAVRSGDVGQVMHMIENGSTIHSGDTISGPLLTVCSQEGKTAMVEYILEQGADPNYQNIVGNTAAHEATRRGHVAVVKILANHGADLNLQTKGGSTVMHTAIENGHLSLVILLADLRVSLETPDTKGLSAAALALQRVSSIFAPPRVSWDIFIFLASRRPLDMHDESSLGKALQGAVKCEYEKAIKTLIDLGAPLDWQAAFGFTAMHIATEHGLIRFVKLLAENGADLTSICDDTGNDALLHAARGGSSECVEWLVAIGADHRRRNIWGLTALDMARRRLQRLRRKLMRLQELNRAEKDEVEEFRVVVAFLEDLETGSPS